MADRVVIDAEEGGVQPRERVDERALVGAQVQQVVDEVPEAMLQVHGDVVLVDVNRLSTEDVVREAAGQVVPVALQSHRLLRHVLARIVANEEGAIRLLVNSLDHGEGGHLRHLRDDLHRFQNHHHALRVSRR